MGEGKKVGSIPPSPSHPLPLIVNTADVDVLPAVVSPYPQSNSPSHLRQYKSKPGAPADDDVDHVHSHSGRRRSSET